MMQHRNPNNGSVRIVCEYKRFEGRKVNINNAINEYLTLKKNRQIKKNNKTVNISRKDCISFTYNCSAPNT